MIVILTINFKKYFFRTRMDSRKHINKRIFSLESMNEYNAKMKFSTASTFAIAASTVFALPPPPPLPVPTPFSLKIQSQEPKLNGTWIDPHFVDKDVKWAFINSLPQHPRNLFHLENNTSALIYGAGYYASSQTYQEDTDVPVVSFRTKKGSPRGYDLSYKNLNGTLSFRDNDKFYACPIQYEGKKAWVLANWKFMTMQFPPPPVQKGCKDVTLRVAYY